MHVCIYNIISRWIIRRQGQRATTAKRSDRLPYKAGPQVQLSHWPRTDAARSRRSFVTRLAATANRAENTSFLGNAVPYEGKLSPRSHVSGWWGRTRPYIIPGVISFFCTPPKWIDFRTRVPTHCRSRRPVAQGAHWSEQLPMYRSSCGAKPDLYFKLILILFFFRVKSQLYSKKKKKTSSPPVA